MMFSYLPAIIAEILFIVYYVKEKNSLKHKKLLLTAVILLGFGLLHFLIFFILPIAGVIPFGWVR